MSSWSWLGGARSIGISLKRHYCRADTADPALWRGPYGSPGPDASMTCRWDLLSRRNDQRPFLGDHDRVFLMDCHASVLGAAERAPAVGAGC